MMQQPHVSLICIPVLTKYAVSSAFCLDHHHRDQVEIITDVQLRTSFVGQCCMRAKAGSFLLGILMFFFRVGFLLYPHCLLVSVVAAGMKTFSWQKESESGTGEIAWRMNAGFGRSTSSNAFWDVSGLI